MFFSKVFVLVLSYSCLWVLVFGRISLLRLDENYIPNLKPYSELNMLDTEQPHSILPRTRPKRNEDHIISDCLYMTSEEGNFFYKSLNNEETVCGIYMFTEPDQRIEIHFNYFDVPCEIGGLVAFIDGWEMNGEIFPSKMDDSRPMRQRFAEFCGEKKIKQIFVSSQNVAFLQYRIPGPGKGFSFTTRFIKNPAPCNIFLQDEEDVITLRNYGNRTNCSVSAMFPAEIHILALSVGVVPTTGRRYSFETGSLYKCKKRGLSDYVEIGGSSGLDNSNLYLADSVCGMDSKPAKFSEMIGCGTTTVRLVSSGIFDNSVTVALRRLDEERISNGFFSVLCPMEENKK
ncbi:corticotropin-releasing factor-binding protein [Agrilus planipennis]|uniref:Corticotropin-releasing factor-binding protein n=1 Tax=Agrilus planipennis TaxID=224129 RepID=A0A1W4XJ62_AGRPL|nr:corticotropin-releasing factor-binding protein [Agrilus planipennis]